MTYLTLFCSAICAVSLQDPIDGLLDLCRSYDHVEKTISLLKQSDTRLDQVPCISPLRAEDFRHLRVSSAYGTRLHPILNEYKHHSGVDLPGEMGEKVYATANGVVESTGQGRAIGKYIKIRHGYGFRSVYGHLSKILVVQHDSVRIGQVIGQVGSTGRSTGPHLHYGISKNGIEQDPLPYCYLYLRWQKKQVSLSQ